MDQVEDKRQAILDATLRLISENGFHGTAMSKVAKEAGVSTGIIYHYFDSKDDLIFELYKDIKLKSVPIIAEGIDSSQPVRTQIRQLLSGLFRYYLNHPDRVAFVEQYVRSPYYDPEVESGVIQAYQPLFRCVYDAKEQGIIKDLPEPIISALTLDVATSLAQKQANGIIELTPELIDRVIDASWEAIRQ